MKSKLNLACVSLVFAVQLYGCPGIIRPEQPVNSLTIDDCDPILVKAITNLGAPDPIASSPITYEVVEPYNPRYVEHNQVFKKAAQLKCNAQAAKTFTSLTSKSIQDAALLGANPESIQQAVGGKPQGSWTLDDAVALIKVEKQRGELKAEQALKLADATGNVIVASVVMVKLPGAAADLITSASNLHTPDPNPGDDILRKGQIAYALTSALHSALALAREAATQTKDAVAELDHLRTALQSI